MQIVINISVDTFCDLKRKQNRTEVDNAVLNGIPLPKGHGRLVDADKLWDSYHDLDYDFYEAFDLADTILEADIAEGEE